jgi:hypothetical protein
MLRADNGDVQIAVSVMGTTAGLTAGGRTRGDRSTRPGRGYSQAAA